jgi:hypothetical protein
MRGLTSFESIILIENCQDFLVLIEWPPQEPPLAVLSIPAGELIIMSVEMLTEGIERPPIESDQTLSPLSIIRFWTRDSDV